MTTAHVSDVLADDSVLLVPGFLGMIASRLFADGTLIGIEPQLHTNRICIAYKGTEPRCWDDIWCYEKDIDVIAVIREWKYPEVAEPEGWHRNPTTGRRRPNGDASEEYIRY